MKAEEHNFNEFKALQAELLKVKEENQKLKDLIKNGGLPNQCVMGYDEVKFCLHRNGEGNQCLRCFS